MAFWSVRRMVSFEKLDSASLIDSIRGALLGKILSGELRPGDRLPAERDMAAQLGVSRSSLHHAVLQLESQGFLKVEPRRGTEGEMSRLASSVPEGQYAMSVTHSVAIM